MRTHQDVEANVFVLLNWYEYICTGANMSLFDSEIIERMRGHAMRLTWQDYYDYIMAQRKVSKKAWSEYDYWIKSGSGQAQG